MKKKIALPFLVIGLLFCLEAGSSSPSPSLEDIVLSRATWEKANWGSINKSPLWSMSGWERSESMLGKFTKGPTSVQAYRAVKILGLPMVAMLLINSESDEYMDQFAIEGSVESTQCARFIAKLNKTYGTPSIDVDVSSPAKKDKKSVTIRTTEWDLGTTRFQLKCLPAPEGDKYDPPIISLRFLVGHRDSLSPVKPLITLHCSFTRVDAQDQQMESVYSIDENFGLVLEGKTFIAGGSDVVVTPEAISFTERIGGNGGLVSNIQISRMTGKARIDGGIGSAHGLIFVGDCTKVGDKPRKF